MSTAPDILDLIRHAVLDLQNANYQTYHRPLAQRLHRTAQGSQFEQPPHGPERQRYVPQ